MKQLIVCFFVMQSIGIAASDYGISSSFTIDNRVAPVGNGESNDFTIDNRDLHIGSTQLNRISAVIPQRTILDSARTTMPLKFPGESLGGGQAPIDLGPLSVTARIVNPTGHSVPVKLKIARFTDPGGKVHTRWFNRSYSLNAYYYNVEAQGSRDLSLYVIPPENTPGQWQCELDLYVRKGFTIFSEEKVQTTTLSFMVLGNPKQPTVPYPDFATDALGNILMPPEQITLSDTVWYTVYQNINALGGLLDVGGSAGGAFSNYYEGLSDLLASIRDSAHLQVTPKTIATDVEYNIHWDHINYDLPGFGMDRAVILANFSEGIPSGDLIDSGTAHVLENGGQVYALMWLINAADKRIWRLGSNGYEWIPRDLSFKVRADSVAGKEVQFSLQLQLGPFANDSINYQDLAEAPWVYDYNKWRTNPQDVYWYDIAVTDPVVVIDSAHSVALNNTLDYFLIADTGSVFIPYECLGDGVTVNWNESLNPPDLPFGFSRISSAWSLSTAPAQVSFSKLVTVTLPYDLAGWTTDQIGIYRWDEPTGSWQTAVTEISTEDTSASAKVSNTGVFAVLASDASVAPPPDITLISPSADAVIENHRPRFGWTDPTPDGWLYQIQIDESPDFNSPITDSLSPEPNFLQISDLEELTYYWRVRRADHIGTVSEWTTTASFTVVSDTTPPSILEMEPADAIEVASGEIVISARASDSETQIDPNSIVMSLDSQPVDSYFDALGGVISFVPLGGVLSPGEHTVELTLADLSGNKANISWSFTASCNLLLEVAPVASGVTVPSLGSHIVTSKDTAITCVPQPGYVFVKWTIAPEGAGTLADPSSASTMVSLLTDAAILAHCSLVDLTGDSAVNLADFAMFSLQWVRYDCATPDWCNRADFDLSGSIDMLDLLILADNWLGD